MAHSLNVSAPRPGEADAYLDYLFREWQAVPTLVVAWPAMPEDDRLEFVVEWGIREDRLQQLGSWAAARRLTESQSNRLAELQSIIGHHRPRLEALFTENAPPAALDDGGLSAASSGATRQARRRVE